MPGVRFVHAASGKSLELSQGHSFDMAKSGYVNLLPANRKHAKNPGDNAVMMRARKRFLDAGHYAPLLQALEQAAVRYGRAGGVLLDARMRRGILYRGCFRGARQGRAAHGDLWGGYFQECSRCGGKALPAMPILPWAACTICRWRTSAVICS